jgi:hypothetical protein
MAKSNGTRGAGAGKYLRRLEMDPGARWFFSIVKMNGGG